LTSILGGTPFHDILNKYHNEEFVYGTSAEAASNSMIYQGSSSSLIKGKSKSLVAWA
jgi:cyanophycinase-like exopeptidase